MELLYFNALLLSRILKEVSVRTKFLLIATAACASSYFIITPIYSWLAGPLPIPRFWAALVLAGALFAIGFLLSLAWTGMERGNADEAITWAIFGSGVLLLPIILRQVPRVPLPMPIRSLFFLIEPWRFLLSVLVLVGGIWNELRKDISIHSQRRSYEGKAVH